MENSNLFNQTVDVKFPSWAPPTTRQTKPSLAHLPLADPHNAYYRSKLPTLTGGANPLIAAASALFITLTQYHYRPLADTHTLYLELIHEIKAFETRTQIAGYRPEIILVARYLLCATLDEILLHPPYRLLNYFHNEEDGSERFFIIIERLCTEPTPHIELLELAYLCLSHGFKGQYQENNGEEIEKIMEKLYFCIEQQRAHTDPTPPPVISPPPITAATSHLPLWVVGMCTCALLLVIYAGFTFMLRSSVAPLYQQLHSISRSYAENQI